MLCFLKHARIACILTVLRELTAPEVKVQSARKICSETVLLFSCSVTFLWIFQPDLMAIRTYFTRWLIRTNLYDLTRTICMTTLNCTYFTSCTIRMNLYEWPTPNPTPKPNHHWGLDKSYKIVRVRSYKFVRISHLVKYVRIGHEIALEFLQGMDVTIWNVRQTSSQILNENHL